MPTAFDLGLALLIVLGLPLRALLTKRSLERLPESEHAARRPAVWRRAILSQWLLVAGVVALWWQHGRSLEALGVIAHPTTGLLGVLAGVAVMAALLHRQRPLVGADPEVRVRVRQRLAGAWPILPQSSREYGGFVPLAITAGVCEEVLFRGFLVWLLSFVMPWWAAGLTQAVLFGMGHAYQGPRGVVLTGLVGLFLMGVVWLTGSLWAAIVIHALMDLHAGDMAWRVRAGEIAALESEA